MSPKTKEGAAADDSTAGPPSRARIPVPALALLGLVLVFQNTGPTRIRLIGPEITMPLWTVLLATGLIGAVCGAYAVKRRGR
ncbi:LapA family protein [Streptomyces sp. NPDC002671]